MSKFKTKTVIINGIKRKTDEVVTEIWNVINSPTKERAYPLITQLQAATPLNDELLRSECNNMAAFLTSPTPILPNNTSQTAGSSSNINPRPDDNIIPIDDNIQPKSIHPPRRFKIAENYKERMLQFLHLAHLHHWFVSRSEDGTNNLSFGDIYYWFGQILGYDFNKNTSMLTKMYKSETQRKQLAQEFQSFAKDLFDMTQEEAERRNAKIS